MKFIALHLTCLFAAVSAQVAPSTIMDIIANGESRSSLVAAIEYAGLGETLVGEGPFTLFAPTNDGFPILLEALDANTLTDLDVKLVDSVLKYHIVASEVLSSGLQSGLVSTVLGEDICVQVVESRILINGIAVMDADFQANNGVVHFLHNGTY